MQTIIRGLTGTVKALGYDSKTKKLNVKYSTERIVIFRGISPELFSKLSAQPRPETYIDKNLVGRYTRLVVLDKIASSYISRISYETGSHVLRVRIGTSVYKYAKVQPAVFMEFTNADSKGKYFNENIKGVFERL